jgi:hypothetical protein
VTSVTAQHRFRHSMQTLSTVGPSWLGIGDIIYFATEIVRKRCVVARCLLKPKSCKVKSLSSL